MTRTQKKNMVIVCYDEIYLKSIEYHLAKALYSKVDLSFITNKECLDKYNRSPKDIDILFIESGLYNEVISKQNCRQIFLLVDVDREANEQEKINNVTPIYKYSSVRSIIYELDRSLLLDKQQSMNNSTKIISVYSPGGGCGKTTIALGLASAFGKKGYKTLFFSTEMLQDYQMILNENTYLSEQIGYQCKLNPDKAVEKMLINSKKREFSYFPSLKRILPSYGIETKDLLTVCSLLQKKNIFDYIVIEISSELKEEKINFLNQSDSVVVVTKQDNHSALKLQKFFESMVEWRGQTVIVNNFYDETKDDHINTVSKNIKYLVCETVEVMEEGDVLQAFEVKNILDKTVTAVL